MKKYASILAIAIAATTALAADKASSLTNNYITWTFDKDYPVGQFVNGDWYVIGDPVKVVAITNALSDKSFLDLGDVEHSGSMLNPVVDASAPAAHSHLRHGYDSRAKNYIPELNAARPDGKPVAKDNPIVLKPNDSLISMVSWLWRSEADKEPGCPPVPANPAEVPRPSQRAGAVLTVLAEAPPAGTFRPSYAGTEKRLLNVSQLKRDRLRNLAPAEGIYADAADPAAVRRTDRYPHWSKDKNDPISTIPGAADELTLYWSYIYGVNIPLLVQGTARPWIDHLPDWYSGTFLKPSINVCNYGREMCLLLSTAMVALNTDWTKIEGIPPDATADIPAMKEALIINMCQIGIDWAGCADAGTYWPANGGHHGGRKPAILFAGILLDDEHMKNVGQWTTRFHDNEFIKYVDEEMVEMCNSPKWNPDWRGTHVAPYSKELIGMPEWTGAANAGWNTPYRCINDCFIQGFALALVMMEDGRKLFAHEPYFDFADRCQGRIREETKHISRAQAPAFVQNMWATYRKDYPTTYDAAKWDSDAVIAWCTTPVFSLKAAPKAYGIFELKDDEPIRMAIGHDVDLSGLNPDTVTVASPEGRLAVAAIEPSGNPGAYFTIKFAEGVELKKGVRYTVTVDEEVSGKWRNAIGMKPVTNKTTFDVR